jgi:hypothetical protein
MINSRLAPYPSRIFVRKVRMVNLSSSHHNCQAAANSTWADFQRRIVSASGY